MGLKAHARGPGRLQANSQWHRPRSPACWEVAAGESGVKIKPHGEFEASLGYGRPCLLF